MTELKIYFVAKDKQKNIYKGYTIDIEKQNLIDDLRDNEYPKKYIKPNKLLQLIQLNGKTTLEKELQFGIRDFIENYITDEYDNIDCNSITFTGIDECDI